MANGDTREFPDEAHVYFDSANGKLTIDVDDRIRVFSDAAWIELIYPEEQTSGVSVF